MPKIAQFNWYSPLQIPLAQDYKLIPYPFKRAGKFCLERECSFRIELIYFFTIKTWINQVSMDLFNFPPSQILHEAILFLVGMHCGEPCIVEGPCTNWDSCMTVTKNAWSPLYSILGGPQVPIDKLIPAKRVLPGEKTHWEQVINFKKRQISPGMPGKYCILAVCLSKFWPMISTDHVKKEEEEEEEIRKETSIRHPSLTQCLLKIITYGI